MEIINFDKILIANRGEIAVRIIKTCRKMGIATVAVYSDADKDGLHVQMADEAVRIGPAPVIDSYLNQDAIIEATKKTGAQAIHPGFGFLSENASFARRCSTEGIVFIGPRPEAIEAMGLKIEAKKIVSAYGVPLVPGYNGEDQSIENLITQAQQIGFPLLVKASAGGGGKGMRIVRSEQELQAALEGAKREAAAAFGDDTLFMERYFESAKHIEFQILGDKHGNLIHCYERECSVQRRYQKIIEESPSPALDEPLRQKMAQAALAVGRSVEYDNAGTVEFILDEQKNFYFLEVNTRLQVEHPVTESILGIDLVQYQIEVAMGYPLSIQQSDLKPRGHAVECRIYAEDAANNFAPATGKILAYIPDNSLRFDSGVTTGSEISSFYDPMIAKVIAHGQNRQEAIRKMHYGLRNFILAGTTHNIHFLDYVLSLPDFQAGKYDTRFISQILPNYSPQIPEAKQNIVACLATVYQAYVTMLSTRPLGNVPFGWRNNFYAPLMQEWKIDNQNIVVHYQYSANDATFHCKTNDTEHTIQIIDYQSTSGFLTFCLDNVLRQNCHIIQAAVHTFVHLTDGTQVKLEAVERFPQIQTENAEGSYITDVPGQVIKIHVQAGDTVQAGEPLLVLLSMKMENVIYAHTKGIVQEIFVSENSLVNAKTPLLILLPENTE